MSAVSWIRPARTMQHASRRFLDKPYASTQLILLAGGGLLAFGLMMAASTTISASLQAGSHQTMWSQVMKEIEFLVLGVPIFWVAVRLPPRAYRMLTYPALLISLVALFAVLVPGIGAADQRRPAVDRAWPAAIAAVGVRQDRNPAVGRRPARPQDRTRHPDDRQAPVRAAAAGLSARLLADHARTRPRYDPVLPADPDRLAVDGRHAVSVLRRAHRRGRGARRGSGPRRPVSPRTADVFHRPVQARAGFWSADRAGSVRARLRWNLRGGPWRQHVEVQLAAEREHRLRVRDHRRRDRADRLRRRAGACSCCSPSPGCASRGFRPTRSCAWWRVARPSGSAGRP